MDVKNHYENHLQKYYNWIYGGFESKTKEYSNFFKSHNIKPVLNKTALDLGAGSGFQSIPLAKLGFKVIAFDISSGMIEELGKNTRELDIIPVTGNFQDMTELEKYSPELIVCMGDTLTHIESIKSVEKTISDCFRILPDNGIFIAGFRDLTLELKDENRFIPVKSDADKIFTCFLEYYPDYVNVYDIVHEKTGNTWEQKISFYKKTRISSDKIQEILKKTGFKIEFFESKTGMITLIARKPG